MNILCFSIFVINIFQYLLFSIHSKEVNGQCDHTITEGMSADTMIKNLNPSSGILNQRFSFKFSQPNSYFKIERDTGWLRSKGLIDREELCQKLDTCQCDSQCYIDIKVVKERIEPRGVPELLKHRICVKDVNDNSPEMDSRHEIRINEDAPVGMNISLPPAHDADSSGNSVISYSIRCPKHLLKLHYVLKAMNGTSKQDRVWVTLNRPLNHEKSTSFQCEVSASDGEHTERMSLQVTVLDINDHSPKWLNSDFNVTVAENSDISSVIFILKASDVDSKYGKISYDFGPQVKRNLNNLFRINTETGEIFLNAQIDYDVKENRLFYIPVVAKDNGDPVPQSATGTLTVSISDVNDKKPIIKPQSTTLKIVENSPPGYLDYITVTDADSGRNALVVCSLGNGERRFKLTRIAEGMYSLNSTVYFDHETDNRIVLTIVCKDLGVPSQTDRKKLFVHIIDVNDSPVKFSQSHFTVNVTEGTAIGSAILTAKANDRDNNPQLVYSLDPNAKDYVNIDTTKGEIYSVKDFDREKRINYTFYVTVTDGGPKNHSDTAWVTLIISDVNDNPPTFEQIYRIPVLENTTINSVIGQVKATDSDEGNNGYVEFRGVDNYALPFRVFSDGRILLTRSLDREEVPNYELIVVATDRGRPKAKSSTTTVVVQVTDVNDNAPRFRKHEYVSNISCHQHYVVTDVRAEDLDEPPNNKIHYKLLRVFPEPRNGKPKFSISLETGDIAMVEAPENCQFGGTRRLVVRAFDPTNVSKYDDTRITVNIRRGSLLAHGNERPAFNGNGGVGSGQRGGKTPYGGIKSDANLFVVVALVCVSVLLAVLMMALILYLKKRQERDRGYEKGTPLSAKPHQVQAPNSCPLPRKQFADVRSPEDGLYSDETGDYRLVDRHHGGHCLEEQLPGDGVMCTSLSADDILFSGDCQGTYSRTTGRKDGLRIDHNAWTEINEDGTLKKGRYLVDTQMSRDPYHTYQTMSSVDKHSTPTVYTDLPPSLISGPGGPGNEMATSGPTLSSMKLVAIESRGIDQNKKGKADPKRPYFTISFV